MTVLKSTLPNALLPKDFGDLLVAALRASAVATNPAVARVIETSNTSILFPRLDTEAPAGFTAEGADLPIGDPSISDIEVIPAKVGGVTVASRESLDDSVGLDGIVGQSLVASISARVDAAFVGNLAAPAPKGLASLTGTAAVTVTSANLTNLDPIADAVAAIASIGGTASAVLVSPAVATRLSKMKAATGSNLPLLGADPTQPGVPTALGLPVITAPALTDSKFYVVDGSRIVTVIRKDAEVDISTERFFESDRVAIRAIARLSFGFLDPRSVATVTIS